MCSHVMGCSRIKYPFKWGESYNNRERALLFPVSMLQENGLTLKLCSFILKDKATNLLKQWKFRWHPLLQKAHLRGLLLPLKSCLVKWFE